MKHVSIALLVVVTACGGNGSSAADGSIDPGGDCELGGKASSDRYLPFSVGDTWRYRVTDPGGADDESIKRQEYKEEFVPEGETEPVIVQETIKATGRTVNWLRQEGDVIIRLRQEDYDPEDIIERTTVYEPSKLRLDESPEHLAQGATWDDVYTSVVYDPLGDEVDRVEIIDQWTVIDVGVPCNTPWGELECIQIHKERIQGGISVKDYWFARGHGKVREEGGQIEELIGCALN